MASRNVLGAVAGIEPLGQGAAGGAGVPGSEEGKLMAAKAHFYESKTPLNPGVTVTARCGAVVKNPIPTLKVEHAADGTKKGGYEEVPFTWGLCRKCRLLPPVRFDGEFYAYAVVTGQDEQDRKARVIEGEVSKHREAA